jgi:transposase
MNKLKASSTELAFCGIDVSAASLSVALIKAEQHLVQREFSNTASGHRLLLVWLGQCGAMVRVALEATGVYALDLALALDADAHCQVAVLNPKLVNRFAQTLVRNKTDAADAVVLAEYSRRMPFTPWSRPSVEQLRLRALGRYIASLTTELTGVKNQLHAAQICSLTPRVILLDLKQAQTRLERRLAKMRQEARKLVAADHLLQRRFDLLTTMPGIAETSALSILCELVMLPPEMTVRQWVAMSGLDPSHRESGTSVHQPARISRAGNRHLRRALYMPALSAARHDPHLRAFYRALVERHKTALQALMAVARKMLHAIFGIFKSDKPYDGQRLFPQLEREVKSIAG